MDIGDILNLHKILESLAFKSFWTSRFPVFTLKASKSPKKTEMVFSLRVFSLIIGT
jgi:hypothetical protein